MPEHRVPQWHPLGRLQLLVPVIAVWLALGQVLHAQRNLDQRDNDFYFIVTKNAERMGLPINKNDSTPERLVDYAHALCRDIPQQGIKAVVENNRAVAWASLPVAKDKQQQAADMFFRNALSTYCQQYIPQASEALAAAPSPPAAQVAEAKSANSLYQRFQQAAVNQGINLKDYRSFTEAYVQKRARLFCSLLDQGEIVKLQTELSFGTIVWLEPKEKRPQLENIILQEGTDTYCIQHRNKIAR